MKREWVEALLLCFARLDFTLLAINRQHIRTWEKIFRGLSYEPRGRHFDPHFISDDFPISPQLRFHLKLLLKRNRWTEDFTISERVISWDKGQWNQLRNRISTENPLQRNEIPKHRNENNLAEMAFFPFETRRLWLIRRSGKRTTEILELKSRATHKVTQTDLEESSKISFDAHNKPFPGTDDWKIPLWWMSFWS